MNLQSPSFNTLTNEPLPPNKCAACSKDVFSDIDSDDDNLPNSLLDHYLDQSRSAKKQKITDRPCYHGKLKTPLVNFSVAALQLSHDLLDKVEHIPKGLVISDKCGYDEFYQLIGHTSDSTEILTNIIVFKFIAEDVEDEAPIENLYQHLVKGDSLCFTKLKCDLFDELYLFPLAKGSEPPPFLPITSRLNLEPSPREDNILLGVLVKKGIPEEGEIQDEEDTTPIITSPILTSETFSPESPTNVNAPELPLPNEKPSSPTTIKPIPTKTKTKQSSSTHKLIPIERYGSYINTDDLPFLTDPVSLSRCIEDSRKTSTKVKSIPSTSTSKTHLDNLFDSEGEDETSAKKTKPSHSKSHRKRTLTSTRNPATASQSYTDIMDSNSQIEIQRVDSLKASSSSSSSLPNISSSSSHRHRKPSATSSSDEKISPQKFKRVKGEVIDLESSESDPDADLFPRQANKAMTGVFVCCVGDFGFKYHVIRSDRPEVDKYLPTHLNMKGRVAASQTEECLINARLKPNCKLIIFQLMPRETEADKKAFKNLASYLINRNRYGMTEYRPEAYRNYILPVVKGTKDMKIFEILRFKPKKMYGAELYGLIIKKSAMTYQVKANPNVDLSAIESADYTNWKTKFGHEDFPDLDVREMANMIHSSVDDLLNLSAAVANLLKKTTENEKDPKRKAAANIECQNKVIFIMGLEDEQHAKRRKAYDTILSWLKAVAE